MSPRERWLAACEALAQRSCEDKVARLLEGIVRAVDDHPDAAIDVVITTHDRRFVKADVRPPKRNIA